MLKLRKCIPEKVAKLLKKTSSPATLLYYLIITCLISLLKLQFRVKYYGEEENHLSHLSLCIFFDRKVNWLHQGYACGNVKQVNIEIGQLEAKFGGNP